MLGIRSRLEFVAMQEEATLEMGRASGMYHVLHKAAAAWKVERRGSAD